MAGKRYFFAATQLQCMEEALNLPTKRTASVVTCKCYVMTIASGHERLMTSTVNICSTFSGTIEKQDKRCWNMKERTISRAPQSPFFKIKPKVLVKLAKQASCDTVTTVVVI